MAQDGFFGQDGFGHGTMVGITVPVDATANWPLSLTRFFLVDLVNGIDTNVGYVDAATNATIDPTGKARKTIAGMLSILPRNMAGRDFEILLANADLANGTNYAEVLDLSGVSGFRRYKVRGSTDLTNSTTDQVLCGSRLGQAGPNVDGSWTVQSANAASVTFAAGTLTAEADGGGITGMRLRRTSDNSVLLGAAIWRNSSTVIEHAFDTTVLGVGETVWVERPGVMVSSFHTPNAGSQLVGGNSDVASQVIGLAITGTAAGAFGIGDGSHRFVFCEAATSTTNQVTRCASPGARLQFSRQYLADVSGTPTNRVVGGCRFNSCLNLNAGEIVAELSSMAVTRKATGSLFNNNRLLAPLLNVGGGNNFRGMTFVAAGLSSAPTPLFAIVGSSILSGGTTRPLRNQGRGIFLEGPITVVGVEMENVNADPSLPLLSIARTSITNVLAPAVTVVLENVRNGPAGNNTGDGISLLNAVNSTVIIGRASTVDLLGTAGRQIVYAGAALGLAGSVADLSKTNIVDNVGNNIMGPAGFRIRETALVRAGVDLAAVGRVVRSNGTGAAGAFVVVPASADTDANSRGLGVNVTTGLAGENIYIATAGTPYVEWNTATPTISPTEAVRLSEVASPAGFVRSSAPGSGNVEKILGFVADLHAGGLGAYVAWHPESRPVAVP